MEVVSHELEVAVEVVSHSHNYLVLGLEVVEETVTMVTRAAAEHASVVHTLRNALLEVEVYLAAKGQTLNSAKEYKNQLICSHTHETLGQLSGVVLCSTLPLCRCNVCNNFSPIRPQRLQKGIPAHPKHPTDICSTLCEGETRRSMGNPFSWFPTRDSSATASTKMPTGISNNLGAMKSSQRSDRSSKNFAAEMLQKQ